MRLAVVGVGPHGARNLTTLVSALRFRGFDVVPTPVATYSALYEVVSAGECELAWSPPLVALDLWRCAAAIPLVRPVRSGLTVYYSVLLAAGERRSIEAHRGARVGWVAPESAAGYVVPRLGLRSLGLDADDLFGARKFLGTHGRAVDALRRGQVDIAATHASLDANTRRFSKPDGAGGLHVVAAYGPIPSDVIVVGPAVSPSTQGALREAFATVSVEDGATRSVDRFEPATPAHFKPLEELDLRSEEGALRVFTPLHARETRLRERLFGGATLQRGADRGGTAV